MLSLVIAVALAAAPASPAAAAPAPAAPSAAPKAEAKSEAQTAPKAEPKAAPADPEVQKAVAQMQKFYEDTQDFSARFEQSYSYKTFARKTTASGTMKFMKAGASMRWDYLKPEEKVFVVAANKVYAYVKEAKQLTVSPIDTDKLSTSVTFLWGKGKLDREFDIRRAQRKDLKGGIALELTPKTPDPRFQKVFFLLDPKSYEVKESIVVDPDGSENRIAFLDPKINQGLTKEAFAIEPPADTQIIRMDQGGKP